MSKQYFVAYDKVTKDLHKTKGGRLSRFIEGSKRYKEIIKTHNVKEYTRPIKYYILNDEGLPIPSRNKLGYLTTYKGSKNFDKVNKIRADHLQYQLYEKLNTTVERVNGNIMTVANKIVYPVSVRIKSVTSRINKEEVDDFSTTFEIFFRKLGNYGLMDYIVDQWTMADNKYEADFKKNPKHYEKYINRQGKWVTPGKKRIVVNNLEELMKAVGDLTTKALREYDTSRFNFIFEQVNRTDLTPVNLSFVAHSMNENCLMNGARLVAGNVRADKIYKTVPSIAKATADSLGINVEDLDKYLNTKALSNFVKIDQAAIKLVASKGKFLFNFHTPLGLILKKRWLSIGGAHYTGVNFVVVNNHCELLNRQEYTKVVIHELDNYETGLNRSKLPDTAQLVFRKGTEDIIEYANDYTTNEDGKIMDIVLHKYIDPSKIDLPCVTKHLNEYGNCDQLHFSYITNEQKLFSYCARKHFKLRPTDNDYKEIVKKSVVFISSGFTGEVDLGLSYETDKNRCYLSYTTNKYYKGLPNETLYEMEYNEDKKEHIAFVIPKKVDISKSLYKEGISYLLRANSLECMTYVLYLWLINNGCEIEISYCLYAGRFQDIDLLQFYRSHNFGGNEKVITNRFIGELIAGGMTENNIKTFTDLNTETMSQMRYEAAENNLPYTVDSYIESEGYDRIIYYADNNDIRYKYNDVGVTDDSGQIRILADIENTSNIRLEKAPHYLGTQGNEEGIMMAMVGKDFNVKTDIKHHMTVDVKSIDKGIEGCFHTYSWLLSYAAITMLELWKKCVNKGLKVLAFNVDSLITDKRITGIPFNNKLDGWKSNECEMFRKNYTVATPMENLVLEFNNVMTDPKPFIESDRLVIHGPAGISKSHTFYSQKMTNTVMTAPTKVLRDSIKKNANGNLDCMTVQKLFGLSMNDLAWSIYLQKNKRKHYKWVIIDEFTQLTKNQFNTILKRCGNCVLILLGDFEQLQCDIEGAAVTREFFEKRGFTFRYMSRKEGAYARHNYEYGCELDALRGDNYDDLDSIGYQTLNSMEELEEGIKEHPNSCLITYKHSKNIIYNSMARKYHTQILCVNSDNDHFTLDIKDERIWWDRKNMNEKLPKGFKVEPRFSRTIYSLQGSQSSELTYFIDVNELKWIKGALYTALTRAVNKEQIYLINFGGKVDDNNIGLWDGYD